MSTQNQVRGRRSTRGGRGRGGRGGGGRGGRGGGRNSTQNTNGTANASTEQQKVFRNSSNTQNSQTASTQNGSKQPTAREIRKSTRREKQLRAVNAKASAEDNYFWSCIQSSNGLAGGPSDRISDEQLFRAHTGVRGIDFHKYSDIRVDVSDDSIQPIGKYSDLSSFLGPEIQLNLKRMHYDTPTPIQKYGVPSGVQGRDLMCCAQTGSGKTCCFLVPMIHRLQGVAHAPPRTVRGCCPVGLILAPTRELAIQIEEEARKLCRGTQVVPVCVYGGAPARPQLSTLAATRARKQLVVATPGRLVDFVSRGLMSLECVRSLTLDEADRMLDMGFEPQVRRIVERFNMPGTAARHTLLFSATFPPAIQKLAGDFLREGYVWIAVGRVGSTTASIEQRILLAPKDKAAKMQLLADQLGKVEGRTLVFVQRKRTASQVRKALARLFGISGDEIHGDRSQPQREAALDRFRRGESRVLVATNVAARGLDIAGVSHVINFDLPVAESDFDDYVHRVGRTGRAGHRGVATSFYMPGFEAKVGNGAIAPQLLKLLVEAKQEVPEWFSRLPETKSRKGNAPKAKHTVTDHRLRNAAPRKMQRVNPNGSAQSGRGPADKPLSSQSTPPNAPSRGRGSRGGRGRRRGRGRGGGGSN